MIKDKIPTILIYRAVRDCFIDNDSNGNIDSNRSVAINLYLQAFLIRATNWFLMPKTLYSKLKLDAKAIIILLLCTRL